LLKGVSSGLNEDTLPNSDFLSCLKQLGSRKLGDEQFMHSFLHNVNGNANLLAEKKLSM
jgi:hypothetical protein